ncbi:hypothetical protein L9F63_019751 [Diploptera punctata]|uniref:Ionotropic glutamate receptor C-terminal domain-containing protein n=1 Tax=Diploptera punctata TaxID=6984 RepID=A0AAD8EE89_DIPPU|nr:hypothetical protein L9F63_019751 [Diploptera punctata]
MGLYKGVDSQILFNMAKFFNFTPNIIKIKGISYGFYLQNGTYTGVLRDIATKKADIGFNSRFIKQYGNEIEFSNTVMNDEACIIVPKSKLVPRWRRILLSFNLQFWIILLTTYIVIVTFWYYLRRFNNYKNSKWFVICGVLKMFLLSGISHPPNILSERFLFASILMFCIVITNGFQSFLVTNVTSPNYESDINTLEELDEANLPIWSRSPDNRDIFKDIDTPVMQRLYKKFAIFNGTNLMKHAYDLRDAAIIVRKTSSLYIEAFYVAKDGSQLLHTVKECPASYQLAYIVPSGSPYLFMINTFILKMNEAGLTYKWHEDAMHIHSLLMAKKFVNQEALRAFSLTDLQLSFYIYMCGTIISILTYILETMDTCTLWNC